MDRIEDDGALLALVWRDADWGPGMRFCTPAELFLQAGCWQYPAGKDLGNHRHKPNPRTAAWTQLLSRRAAPRHHRRDRQLRSASPR